MLAESLSCVGGSSMRTDRPHLQRRVSFSSDGDGDITASTLPISQQRTKVIRLPWTDARGVDAEYTGEVNTLIQPHGFGSLQYKDGTEFMSTWCNGMPSSSTKRKSRRERRSIYDLGDVVTSSNDMITESSSQKALLNAINMMIHSFAFVKRSNGSWRYAIVANRPVETGPKASIRFVVDKRGATKTFKLKHWAMCIRLVKDINNLHEYGYETQDVRSYRNEEEVRVGLGNLHRLNEYQYQRRGPTEISIDTTFSIVREVS